MKTIPAKELKTHYLRIVDNVRKHRQPVLITKKGIGVAKLVPIDNVERDVFGCMAEELEIIGDIETSLVDLKAWKIG
jgi:prevent-host-death family protein